MWLMRSLRMRAKIFALEVAGLPKRRWGNHYPGEPHPLVREGQMDMRRAILLLASMALAVLLAIRVALAATIQCPNRTGNLCVGTDTRDTMYGTTTKDVMCGLSAADMLRAGGLRQAHWRTLLVSTAVNTLSLRGRREFFRRRFVR